MEITNINQLDLSGTYSYADYLIWKFQERVELLRGKIFKMSPAPNTNHQRISANLSGEFWSFFRHKECQFFSAPFDVRLTTKNSKDKEIQTVVQPDLCVFCDPEKVDEKGGIGAPDLVVEILSPGNSKKEMKLKYDIYEEVGVREYWVVRPVYEEIQIFNLIKGKFQLSRTVIADEQVTSVIFPELSIEMKSIFEKVNP